MPTDLLYGLPSLFDRLMSRDDEGAFTTPGIDSGHFPPVQVCEDNDAMRVRALLPGAPLDRLSLVLEKGSLILRGVLPAPTGRHHRRERPTGPFQREIRLPSPVGEAPIDAVLRDGVLTVTLPKAAREKRRAISVHYASGVLS